MPQTNPTNDPADAPIRAAGSHYVERHDLPLGLVYGRGTRKEPVGGEHKWTRSTERLDEWLRQYPDAGLFLNLRAAGLVDLDLDVRSRSDFHRGLAELERDLGKLPPTWELVTPSGGEHRLFRADFAKRRQEIAPHVELRSTGTAPLPPSKHYTGGRYEWKPGRSPDDLPCAELPPAWDEYAQRLADQSDGERYLLGDEPITEGLRYRELLRLAGSQVKSGVTGDTLAVVLHAVNEAQCQPPLDVREVEAIVRSAADWPPGEPPHVLMFGRRRRDPDELNGAVAVSYAEIERERVDYLLPAVPLGMLTILAGHPGLGKSMLKAKWAGQVSRGGPSRPAAGVLLLDGEDSPGVTRLRLEAANADLSRVKTMQLRRNGEEVGVVIPDHLPEIERLIVENGVRLLVIDPVNGFFPGGVDYFKDVDVRRVLGPLARMADRLGVAVVIVAHLNKSTGGTTLHRIGGSVGYGAAVRSALFLDRDPDDEDGEQGSRRVLVHAKSNVGPLVASKVLRLVPVEIDGYETARIEIEGDSHLGAGELLARNAERPAKGTRTEACAEALRALLADGERPSREVKALLESAGFSVRTIQRAASENVGVNVTESGFPAETHWALPSLAQTFTRTPSPVAPNPLGATDGATAWRDCENGSAEPSLTPSDLQSRQVPGNGATGRRNPFLPITREDH